MVARIQADGEDDDESVCKMETKKGLVQLKEKVWEMSIMFLKIEPFVY